MKKSSRYILQIGLAITFVSVGIMILQNPEAWGSLIQPWAAKLIPGPIISVMTSTGYLDIIIGILFLFGPTAWIAGLIGALHLIAVLIGTGLPAIQVTIRDVGLLAASIAILIETIPPRVANKIAFWKQ